MNELLKFAQENDLTSEDLEYLFEQGLEKIASDYEEEVLYDAFEKVASAYDVTPEELDYLIQEGFQKVASLRDARRLDGANFGNEMKLRLTEAFQRARQGAGNLARNPVARGVGIGTAAIGTAGAAAYGINRIKKRKETEKVASAELDLTDEEIEYIIAQGLEKVAADLGL